jgi:hypothetical protein
LSTAIPLSVRHKVINADSEEDRRHRKQRPPQIFHTTQAPITYDTEIEIIIESNPTARLSR